MAASVSIDELMQGPMNPEVEEYLERCLIELQTCDEAAVQLEIEALSFFQLEIETLERNRPEKCNCLHFEPVFILSYTINGADCPPVTQWQCYRCVACALLQMPHVLTLRGVRFYAR